MLCLRVYKLRNQLPRPKCGMPMSPLAGQPARRRAGGAAAAAARAPPWCWMRSAARMQREINL